MTSQYTSSLSRAKFLLGTVPIFAIATTAVFPILSLEMKRQGFGEDTIGAITSFYYFGAVTGAFTFGRLVGYVGQRGSIALVAIVAAVSTLGLRLTDDLQSWLMLRFVTGYALGAFYLVMDSWIGSLATRPVRGRLYATYDTVRLLATAVGPLLLT